MKTRTKTSDETKKREREGAPGTEGGEQAAELGEVDVLEHAHLFFCYLFICLFVCLFVCFEEIRTR